MKLSKIYRINFQENRRKFSLEVQNKLSNEFFNKLSRRSSEEITKRHLKKSLRTLTVFSSSCEKLTTAASYVIVPFLCLF